MPGTWEEDFTCHTVQEVKDRLEERNDFRLSPNLCVLDLRFEEIVGDSWQRLGEALYGSKVAALYLKGGFFDDWAYHGLEHGLRGATELQTLTIRGHRLTPGTLETLFIVLASMPNAKCIDTSTMGTNGLYRRVSHRDGSKSYVLDVPRESRAGVARKTPRITIKTA